MIKQCTIIFGCLFAGELFVYLTGITIPSSIVGMLLLTMLLMFNIIKIQHVKPIADLFVKNLAFFFIPPGVALILYLDLLKKELLAVAATAIISTILVLMVTGWVYQLTKKNDE